MHPGHTGHVTITQRPAPLSTSLYDLIGLLHDEMPAADDATIVATVMHLMRSGQLRWRRHAGPA